MDLRLLRSLLYLSKSLRPHLYRSSTDTRPTFHRTPYAARDRVAGGVCGRCALGVQECAMYVHWLRCRRDVMTQDPLPRQRTLLLFLEGYRSDA